jgi:transposase-like protein
MKKRVRRSDPQRERQWQAAVRQWQKSGQSIRDYCRDQGLRESAFYFWRRELTRRGLAGIQQPGDGQPPASKAPGKEGAAARRRRTSATRHDRARFLPVQVVLDREQPGTTSIEIVLRDGRQIRVQSGFDHQVLTDVLRVLEARPC